MNLKKLKTKINFQKFDNQKNLIKKIYILLIFLLTIKNLSLNKKK